MTKKLPKDDRAKVKAGGLEVKALDGGMRVATAVGEKLLPSRLPVAPLKRLLKELDQDRQDRD